MNGFRGFDAKIRLQKKLMHLQAAQSVRQVNELMGGALYDEFLRKNYEGETEGLPRVILELLYHTLKKHPEILEMDLRMRCGKTMRLALE